MMGSNLGYLPKSFLIYSYVMADFNLILLQMVEDCTTNFSGNLVCKTRNLYILAFAQNKYVNNALMVTKPA